MISPYLMPSIVAVMRPRMITTDGIMTASWAEVPGMERVRCRIEVGFYRPGKDMPMPVQAGRAPDRPAVYWVAPTTDVQPGDHFRCISGPVLGTWLVRTAPDRAQGMQNLHHLEGQCIEVAPSVAQGSFPAGEDGYPTGGGMGMLVR